MFLTCFPNELQHMILSKLAYGHTKHLKYIQLLHSTQSYDHFIHQITNEVEVECIRISIILECSISTDNIPFLTHYQSKIPNYQFMILIGKFGSLPVFKWAISNQFEYHRDCCRYAAKYGQLELMIYLLNEYGFENGILNEIMKCQNNNVLHYMATHCPSDLKANFAHLHQ
eukprot:NODE_569_length_5912_cov_0.495957.p3 type:complete len:171 gc:universal NODE_569_length_5912_cov_0.495957:899-387(-)